MTDNSKNAKAITTGTQMLKCPTCQKDLIQHIIEDVVVDECERCGGIWFDDGELDSLSPTQLEAEARDQADFSDDLLACPADSNPLLQATLDGVTFHTCMACNGLWLDGLSVNVLLGVLPQSPDEHQAQDVTCAGCGKRTPREKTAFRFDSHWCEECVIAGDYPGGTGKTLAKQRAEMVLSLGRETQRLHAAKTNNAGLKTLNKPVTMGSRGLHVQFGLLGWIARKIRG